MYIITFVYGFEQLLFELYFAYLDARSMCFLLTFLFVSIIKFLKAQCNFFYTFCNCCILATNECSCPNFFIIIKHRFFWIYLGCLPDVKKFSILPFCQHAPVWSCDPAAPATLCKCSIMAVNSFIGSHSPSFIGSHSPAVVGILSSVASCSLTRGPEVRYHMYTNPLFSR